MASIGGAIGLTNNFQFKETYEKLKEAEQKERLLKPRERIDTLEAKEKDVTEIITHFNAVKMAASDVMSNKTLGQKNLTTEGESAKATIKKGVAAMEFALDVKSLAVKDAFQTTAFESDETPMFSSLSKVEGASSTTNAASFKIKVGEESFSIQVEKSTTISGLAEKIRQAKNEDGKELKDFVNAKIIDTGKDGFRLMLGAAKSGEANAIHFAIDGESELDKALSKEVLSVLGLAGDIEEATAKELVDKTKQMSKDVLKLIGASEFDEAGFKEVLGDEKLELKTADGKSFNVDKDTDVLSLSADKLDAFYEHQTRAKIADWAVQIAARAEASELAEGERPVVVSIPLRPFNEDAVRERITQEQMENYAGSGIDTNELNSIINDLVDEARSEHEENLSGREEVYIESKADWDEIASMLDESSWEDLKDQYFEASAKAWISHMSKEGLSEEITLPSLNDGEEPEVIKLGKDGWEDWGNIDPNIAGDGGRKKNAVIDRFKELHKQSFTLQADIKTAESKLEKAKEAANSHHIQRAQDAVFTYEGITITRPENEVKDLIIGADIKLLKEGKTEFKISADSDAMLENISKFMSAYNSLVNNINAATDFDDKAHKAKGTLLGVSEVQSARIALTRAISKFTNGISLHTLGLELNRDGILEFSPASKTHPDGKSIFKEAYSKDPEAINKFLLGGTDYEKLSYAGMSMSAMPTIASGDLVINDKKIAFDADFIERLNGEESKRPSMSEYREELLRAIKAADIAGIKASFNDDGALVLESDGEQGIRISGMDDKLLQLGLKETTIDTKGKLQKGIFDEIQDAVRQYTGKDGMLNKLDESIKRETKVIKEDMDKIKEDIDKRFDTLRERLVRYDVLLNKLDHQSQMIDGMMKAAFAEKK